MAMAMAAGNRMNQHSSLRSFTTVEYSCLSIARGGTAVGERGQQTRVRTQLCLKRSAGALELAAVPELEYITRMRVRNAQLLERNPDGESRVVGKVDKQHILLGFPLGLPLGLPLGPVLSPSLVVGLEAITRRRSARLQRCKVAISGLGVGCAISSKSKLEGS